tara:strand:+ start:539 stop:1534 length:996 start_codon:yes stop_codon:yes gene_type:complete
MAIIRQRLPIPGPFDIRLGLPRGKHFDPKFAKKQLAQKANPNTTINRFRSMVAGAEGLYRPAKFFVVLEFPNRALDGDTFEGLEFQEYRTDLQFLTETKNSIKDRLFFFCSSASLPERTITDTSANQYYGPERNIARGMEFAPINLNFMLDAELSERTIFESWQNLVINQRTFNANFYDEYVGRILIFPLHENKNETSNRFNVPATNAFGPMASLTLAGYYIEIVEAYPKTIGAVDLAYNNGNAIANQSITFNYRYWQSNATIHKHESANSFGDINGTGVITEDKYLGPFAGIINKLPPEIRRAGRDVLNQVKTRFPIGRIFGGRVFPPFF